MANLASSFTLPTNVGVEEDLGNKENEHNRQGKRQRPDQAMSRSALANHHGPQIMRAFHYCTRG
jgi:hypothetical protein